jgi:hypothetical protein
MAASVNATNHATMHAYLERLEYLAEYLGVKDQFPTAGLRSAITQNYYHNTGLHLVPHTGGRVCAVDS